MAHNATCQCQPYHKMVDCQAPVVCIMAHGATCHHKYWHDAIWGAADTLLSGGLSPQQDQFTISFDAVKPPKRGLTKSKDLINSDCSKQQTNMTNFNATLKTKLEAERPCKRCKGTGIDQNVWFYNDVTKESGWKPGPCKECGATGKIAMPDFDAIFLIVTKGKKGTDKRSFRSAKPKFENEYKNLAEGRAYFVWRLARFHGGQDVTMPVCAEMTITYDPYKDVLDQFASMLARSVFGTDMAGASRWMSALGYDVNVPEGLPASAYSGGPVADENKPAEEQLELV